MRDGTLEETLAVTLPLPKSEQQEHSMLQVKKIRRCPPG
jgi:hypothetical protein